MLRSRRTGSCTRRRGRCGAGVEWLLRDLADLDGSLDVLALGGGRLDALAHRAGIQVQLGVPRLVGLACEGRARALQSSDGQSLGSEALAVGCMPALLAGGRAV